MWNTTDTAIHIQLDNIKYNPKGAHNISPDKAQKWINILKSPFGVQLGTCLGRLKKVDLRNLEIRNKHKKLGWVSVENRRIIISIFGQRMIIPMSKVMVQSIKDGQQLRILADVENVDLDGLVAGLATELSKDNILLSWLVKTVNDMSRGRKLKILQNLLKETQKSGAVASLLKTLAQRQDSLGCTLKALELEIGNIVIEDSGAVMIGD